MCPHAAVVSPASLLFRIHVADKLKDLALESAEEGMQMRISCIVCSKYNKKGELVAKGDMQ